MRNFFRGWKRKFGVVTLVLTCLFAGGWVRSQHRSDMFTNRVKMRLRAIFSVDQSIVLEWAENTEHLWWATVFRSDPAIPNEFLGNDVIRWNFHLLGFRHGSVPADRFPYDVTFVVIPYWSIVLPLTLLSAWLMLSQPNTRVEQEPSVVLPNLGA